MTSLFENFKGLQNSFNLFTSVLSSSAAFGTIPSCPADLPFSCSNDTVVDNLCCFEYPGGVVLQTQFWDYNPAIGPDDAWTVHGLWPDNCDGSFEQFCDPSLEINDISSIIEAHNPELLKEMQVYWKDYKGHDEYLWKHEYNKHGTCYSTLKPSCYGESKEHKHVFDFFNVTMNLYRQLPTYEWLAEAGILPSYTKIYTREEILSVLKEKSGAEPYIRCDYENAFQEVWYFHHLHGSLVGENFTPIDTLTNSRCRASGIKYMPKGSSITTTLFPTHTTDNGPNPTGSKDVGFLTLSGQPGCLIKSGKWYVSGTCATYKLTQLSTGSYTLKSNAGQCTLSDNVFHCGADVKSPFEFEFDAKTSEFSANGVTTFSADKVPRRFEQVDVSRGSGNVEFKLKWKVRW
jgi:ribonuclease T2